MDEDKILIQLDIGERLYPLRVTLNEEGRAREAAKQVRYKVARYRQQYMKSELNTKDFLAMVAVQLSIDNLRLEDKNDTDPFERKMQQLRSEIELYLKNEK